MKCSVIFSKELDLFFIKESNCLLTDSEHQYRCHFIFRSTSTIAQCDATLALPRHFGISPAPSSDRDLFHGFYLVGHFK
jgi:hypothetical protein